MSEAITEQNLIERARKYVEEFYANSVSSDYAYHNFEHTSKVVDAVKIIGDKCGLGEESLENVLLAAWFHDVGVYDGKENHEKRSIDIMKQYFQKEGLSEDRIAVIEACIEATKMPQNPKTLEEKVLADADLYHLSSYTYFSEWELMKKEYELVSGEKLNDMGWLDENIKFFKNHKYFTPFGIEVLQKEKDKNLETIKNRMKWLKKKDKKIESLKADLEKMTKKASAELKPDKARETMLRITARNHLELSAMADNKANIMISINAIILSIVVSVLIRKLEESPFLILPTILLTLVCLTTIVYAILATRPKVSKGMFSEEDVKGKKANLLFFGNYHRMDLDNYVWGMKEMLKDPDYLYSSMIKDIYFVGVVLGRKYKLLRRAYTIFMFGFVLAILSFAFAYMSRTW